MSVYIAIMVATFASAYLLVRLSRFLTSRRNLQEGRRTVNADQRKASMKTRRPVRKSLKPFLIRKSAAGKVIGRNEAALQPGTIRKPWGW
jgi:hypothetical protein